MDCKVFGVMIFSVDVPAEILVVFSGLRRRLLQLILFLDSATASFGRLELDVAVYLLYRFPLVGSVAGQCFGWLRSLNAFDYFARDWLLCWRLDQSS